MGLKINIFLVVYYIMPIFPFNKTLWTLGQQIEDETLPLLNKFFEADFKRNSNIFDILDFHDEDKKLICEIKGRRNKSNQYKETIITCNKVKEAMLKIAVGYKVYLIFVFTDKTMAIELTEETEFKVCITGTNQIEHYLIPVKDLKEVDEDFLS